MSNSSQYHLMRSSSDEAESELQNTVSITQSGSNFNISGEIQHTHHLAEQIGQLLLNESCSDVTLIVEETRFPAHKIILAARSTYFWAMLYGGMLESSSSEICLVGTPVQAFKILLKYIYCGRIQLNSMNFDLVLDVLGLVHKYGFTELESAIADYLKSVLNHRSVCVIYSAAYMYSMNSLISTCLDFFDTYASETLNSSGFIQLNASAVIKLIGRNSFCAPEIDIFNAVQRWIEARPDESEHFPAVLANIRLALIKMEDLLNIVRPSGLIKPDILLDALTDQSKKRSSDLVYRGVLTPNVNVASKSFKAKVLTGDVTTELLVSDNTVDKMSFEKFSRHTISPHDPGIIVELSRCFIINHIQLLLFDRDQRMYSYYVEVSIDHKDWIRVADYRNYFCRARQRIFFNERVVKNFRYIRVVGTYNSNTIQGTFNLVRLEAMYTMDSFEIDPATTLLIPQYNVATIPNNSIVIEGVSRSRNALLNGDTKNYDWDNGYTCHELGSSSIIIQFPQPYLVDSMRLLLWDCDDRSYSFYIEVSCDRISWTKIIEVQQGKSWQTLRFERVAVVFVKIVGTYNSANEVFHCVHFECPAMLAKYEVSKSSETQELEISKDGDDTNFEAKNLLPSTSANFISENFLSSELKNMNAIEASTDLAQPSSILSFRRASSCEEMQELVHSINEPVVDNLSIEMEHVNELQHQMLHSSHSEHST